MPYRTSPVRILTLSNKHDIHAQAVSSELKRRGVSSDLLDFRDWPAAFSTTFSADCSTLSSEINGVAGTDYRAVWLRRPRQPRVAVDIFHEADRQALLADQAIFSDWFHRSIAPHAHWVNPWGVHLSASNKMVQMRCADASGLAVPDTLYSNDPVRIRTFIRQGATVSKPISRGKSMRNERLVLGTHTVLETDLPSDDHLRLQPCFMQRVVAKRAEYRVHVMGSELTTVRFRPKSSEGGDQIDWNFGRDSDRFDAEHVALDARVERAVLKLCSLLGVVFACVDLVEDCGGDLYFLELNQMGQFLWVDHRLPELRLVGKFCDLLLS
jgi:hypothetical protein